MRARRLTIARSILSTLFLSQGVPMLEMGDELWRTQRGNNNPYCQDTELAWVDWSQDRDPREKGAMLEHVRALAALRMRHRVFRRHDFLRGEAAAPGRPKDITWLRVDGGEMTAQDWAEPTRAVMVFRLEGAAVDGAGADPDGSDDSFVVMMNGERATVAFTLPPRVLGESWRVVLDTGEVPRAGQILPGAGAVDVAGGSLVVLVVAR